MLNCKMSKYTLSPCAVYICLFDSDSEWTWKTWKNKQIWENLEKSGFSQNFPESGKSQGKSFVHFVYFFKVANLFTPLLWHDI